MKKIQEVLSKIEPIDLELMEKAQVRLDSLTKPPGSLGKLEAFAKRIVGMTRQLRPSLERKVLFILAGDHGVVREGVSAYPPEVTPQMVYNFLRGGAAINVLARHVGAQVVVVDMGVAVDLSPQPGLVIKKIGYGARNIAEGPAMTREEAIKAIETGIAVVEEWESGRAIGPSPALMVGTGDMGIGNTTPSSAIIACLTGIEVKAVTGRGTGLTDAQLAHKIRVIEKALEVNRPNPQDPIDVLAKVGGYEIGGLAGVVLAAAAHHLPVVVDGLISTAGALLAYQLAPMVGQYLFASHKSVEIGHSITLDKMGLSPILDLSLRLGEGTGAALAMGLLEAGVKIYNEMATFEEAGVSQRDPGSS